MKKNVGQAGSFIREKRQLLRLQNYAEFEETAACDFEYICDLQNERLSFKELSVLLFFQKKQYAKLPGSLACVYRIWKSEVADGLSQRERYALYYCGLQEGGFM